MMKKFIATAAIVFSLITPLKAEETLNIMTEDFPPLNYLSNGKLAGPSYEIITAIQKEIGSNYIISAMPWKRAYKTTLNESNSVLFSMVQSEERKPKFKWVGPIAMKQYAFFAKKGSSINARDIKDLKKYAVGVQNGGITHNFVQQNGFTNIKTISKDNKNLDKLVAGRIDLWFASSSTVFGLIKNHKEIKKEDVVQLLSGSEKMMYIAFNKQTPDSIINKWQKAYDSLYKKGTVKKIFVKHDLAHMFPTKK